VTGRKEPSEAADQRGVDALSRREREVALLASRGETASEIAGQLCVSKRTVESHLVSVYEKLGVVSKSELIHRAPEFGM
jgi:DNA-binding CsgD family transcriptional regulator